MLEQEDVFDAVRRGYTDLEDASNDEIISYFEEVDPESMSGHLSNIKGILFEQEYVSELTAQGIEAQVFEATNHPVVDIAVYDDGELVNELQLKATDSSSYIAETLAENPDVPIVVTSEVSDGFNSDMVIDSGIENEALEELVGDTLIEGGLEAVVDEVVNPFSPLSILGWCFGLPL